MRPERENKDFNPFPGLRPFSEEDSDLFFGRETESGEVIGKLMKNRHVSVLGASGSGKSSLIFSGVIPKLRNPKEGKLVVWKTVSFTPGNDPFRNLASALLKEISEPEKKHIEEERILAELFENQEEFPKAISKYIIKNNEKLLLIVDQFEELFRYSSAGKSNTSHASATKFVDFLVNAVIRPTANIFLIITMRSEYLSECAHYQGLYKFVNESNYFIPGMRLENYREVIEGPVKYAGAKIDPALIETLLYVIKEKNEQLPVLQHVLMRTWTHWKQQNEHDRAISIADYESVGTIINAISLHAEEAYEELNQIEKEICSTIFKTIAGKGPDNKGLRRPSDIATIRAIAKCTGEELSGVLEKFRSNTRCFVMPLLEVALNDNSVIDIQHECLIRLWDRLRGWIENEASSIQIYMQLSEASALFQQGKTALLSPPDLQLAVNWRDQHQPSLAWAMQYNPAFERAMVYLRTSEKAYLEEEHKKTSLQKRKILRIRLAAFLFGIFAIIALSLMFHENVQKISAEKQAVIAEKNAVFAEKQRIQALKEKAGADSIAHAAIRQMSIADSTASIAIRDAEEAKEQKIVADIQKSLAERKAEEAMRQKQIALEQSDSARLAILKADQKAEEAVQQRNAIQRKRMISVGKSMSLKSLQLTGQKDLQALLAYQAYLFNKRNNGPENDADIYAGLYNVALQYGSINYKSFKGHNGEIRSMAFVPGKNEFFTSGSDGKILKWSLDNRDQTLQVLYSGKDIIDVLAVSPDASWLACGSENSSIRMIPLKGNNIGYELKGHKGGIKSLIYSYNGKYLYSASLDGKVLKWDISARTSTNITTGSMEITSIDISSKGDLLAGISTDGNVVVWDPEKNSENFRIETTGKKIKVIKFNPENNLLAIGDEAGNVELWDVSLRKKISSVKAHNSQVNFIQFNTSLNQMATSGNDKKLKLFNITDPSDLSQPPVSLDDNEGFVLVMQFSPDGQLIVSGESGGANKLVSRSSHIDNLVHDICNLISRNMTQEEWNVYVGKDIPLERTCQDKGLNIKVDQIK